MLVWPDSLTGCEPCVFCSWTGWVCEIHHAEPMGHDGCKAAGVPCPPCQPVDGKPDVPWDEPSN